jgi:hypothetical protein
MFDFKNYVIKIALHVQHNTVCNCIYIHANITTCSVTQSQSPVFLFFNFVNLFFKILMYLVVSRFQWLISAEVADFT